MIGRLRARTVYEAGWWATPGRTTAHGGPGRDFKYQTAEEQAIFDAAIADRKAKRPKHSSLAPEQRITREEIAAMKRIGHVNASAYDGLYDS